MIEKIESQYSILPQVYLYILLPAIDVGDLKNEVAATVQRSCLVSHEYISLKILSVLNTKPDILDFKKPSW